MGAASAVPLDVTASDITDLDQAKKEVAFLRTLVNKHASQDWKELAQKAKADKTGWTMWNGKVLLSGASLQYNQPVTLEDGEGITFNETANSYDEGAEDHWYEVPLNTPEIRHQTSMFIPGKLFTTRMPRGVDLASDDPWPVGTQEKYIKQNRTKREYFEENVKDFKVTVVFILVEEFEMEAVCSKRLIKYYEDLGIVVHHTPIKDFSVPTLEIEQGNIVKINRALVEGQNCLVHCMGGTGRTGTVVVGAVGNLGIKNPIKHCRRYGKSTYLEIAEQEQMIAMQSIVLTAEMTTACPGFSYTVVLNHLQQLCAEMADGKFDVVVAADPIGEEEEAVLLKIFSLIDLFGSPGICPLSDFSKFLIKTVTECKLDVDAFSSLAKVDLLQKVFGAIDPDVLTKTPDEDSVKFAVFLQVMNLKPVLGEGVAKATSAAAHGH